MLHRLGAEFEILRNVPILLLPNYLNRLSYRNLLYTAITRAKKTLIVIGTDVKIEQMVRNDRREERYSCLAPMLEDQFVDL